MMIVLHNGHEVVTKDLQAKAMVLFEQGYNFWENQATDESVKLGEPIKANAITDYMNVVAMRQISGG